MSKHLVIQINCLNEADHISEAVQALPTKIEGIDKITVLIVDDGSSDNTSEVATKLGAKVVRHNGNRGLPAAVNTGVVWAIENGADFLVNTDADNQYEADDIELLLRPLLAKTADVAYGQRPIKDHPEFSSFKKYLQLLGARVISSITKLKLDDAASGFRAINKEAMQRYYLLANYSSPLEGLIQMTMKGLKIKVVDVRINPAVRPSRLFKSKFKYVFKSMTIILDNILVYRPLQTFLTLGAIFVTIGVAATGYRLYLLKLDSSLPRLTLLMGAIMNYILGLQLIFFGLNGRLQRANRMILDETLYRVNKDISRKQTIMLGLSTDNSTKVNVKPKTRKIVRRTTKTPKAKSKV